MTLLLRDGYTTTVIDHTYVISDSQFGLESQRYEQFFGLGGGAGDPVSTSFQIGGPVSVWLPFKGDTKVFTAQVNGEIGATFGINILAELNLGSPDPNEPDEPQPGSITATLPYELTVAYPDLDPTQDADQVVGLLFDADFEHGAGAGFETLFPSLVFKMDLVAELDVLLAATLGVFNHETTLTVLDFDVGTVVPLIDIDSARNENPINILGTGLDELADATGVITPAEDYNGDETGYKIEFAQFLSTPENKAAKKADVDKKRGDTQAEDQDVPDPSGLDVGNLAIFIPSINTVSAFSDGIYVTDTTRRLVDGEAVPVDTDSNPLNQGNRAELAALTIDLDGILTYATGGVFPPLEYNFPTLGGSFGPASFSADFGYNLLDVELRAGLPLEQEFTLTPEMQTRLRFFEMNDDGSGPKLDGDGNHIAKPVEVVQIAKALTFVESGMIQSEALNARLKDIAAESLVAATDIDLFIDFAAGVPAAFTGQTASVGGRLVMREVGTSNWISLSSGDILLESAPALGADQTQDLDTSTLELGYFIDRDDTPGNDDEVVALTLEEAMGALRFEDVERILPISETPFLPDLDTLNLLYDGGSTFVEVEHQARPIVTNRTGLEFDLSLLLEGLAANASFYAGIDFGLFDLGVGLDLDVGPVFSQRYPLFNAELIDLFNGSFALEKSHLSTFVLGGPAAYTNFGDATVGDDTSQILPCTDA
ncbi:MAG: calcium-binding protein, partial [Paracoccaceae bacterium]